MKYDHLYRWDLDKTYLETDFDTAWALVRTFFQKPADKENVPGSDLLIRALRRDSRGTAGIFFLSGSPKQMRSVLQEKLRLDGVYCEQIELKDNLRNLLKGRFRALKDQLGFKLPSLLKARSRVPATVTETLFGDDAEKDAFVYSLYADLIAGRIGPHLLERILDTSNLFEDNRLAIYDALDTIETTDCVEHIFIHLNRRSPPYQFECYGRRLVPVYNYLQASFVLQLDGRITPKSVWTIAEHFSSQHKYSLDAHIRSLRDLLRRRLVTVKDFAKLLDVRIEAHDPTFSRALEAIVNTNYREIPVRTDPEGFSVDYMGILKANIKSKNRRPKLFF